MHKSLTKGSLPVALMLTTLLATAAVGTAGAVPSHGMPAPRLTAVKPSAVADAAHTVRLITGDRVMVTGTGVGQTVSFLPDDDSPSGVAQIEQFGSDIRVVPDEVRALLDAGTLDPRLFDIDALIEQGYADGADLPLIVQSPAGTAPADSVRTRKLPGIKAAAARVEGERTTRFWSGLRDRQDGATARKLADGVRKVWLDGKVKATLAESVPQIGAPRAWAAGYDGKGVKVAVLDTGVDATHPDVKDRLVEARNFTDSADATDRHGHGTHVASTVLGSGAASGGSYKGVAPGADLLVGKVLNDAGQGTDSMVIGGMEWAAHSGARVISMSLGGQLASDGADPLSTAVNSLTGETGALFVIAAGNSGPDATTISSPGSADAALTVAAVDRQDKIAPFSSRGPRLRDNALKPDIAAPGVGIVAARAAGTSMGTPTGAKYTAASGTSMATPHVAGAAAIVAQAHPDWTAAEIKGALMSSSLDTRNGGFAEGSGRTDVPAAIAGSVWATNASFGSHAPDAAPTPVTRAVTFHNTRDTAVTLTVSGSLRRDGGADVSGGMTLDSNVLTVPAHGSKELHVTLDPAVASTAGTYTGKITATGAGVTAHATVALVREQRTHKLVLRGLMPDGTPASSGSGVSLVNLDRNEQPTALRLSADGSASADVLPGRYALIGYLRKAGDFVQFGFPDIDVTDQDVSLVADGREAKAITTRTPQRSEMRSVVLSVSRKSTAQRIGASHTIALGRGGGHQYALPSEQAREGSFGLTNNFTLQSPPVVASAELTSGAVDMAAESFSNSGFFDGTRRLDVTDAGYGSTGDLLDKDLKGRLALVRVGTAESVYTALPRVIGAGAAGVMVVNSVDDRLVGSIQAPVPVFGVPKGKGDQVTAALAKGPVTMRLTGERYPSYVYALVDGQVGRIKDDQSVAPAVGDLAAVRTENYRPNTDPTAPVGGQDGWLGYSNATQRGTGTFAPLKLGTTQTVFVNAEGTKWQRVAIPSSGAVGMSGGLEEFEPGSRTTKRWFEPVLHATTPGSLDVPQTGITPARNAEYMKVQIPVWASASGGSWEGVAVTEGDVNEFRAYLDGQLVGTAQHPFVEMSNLPDEKRQYRFELDAKRTAPWWNVSTEAHTAWTFSSAKPAVGTEWQILPLLHADYAFGGVALDSSVKAGKSNALEVSFRSADGIRSRLSSAGVRVSFDRGATWQTLKGRATGSSVTVNVKAPKGAKTISLRVHGTNEAGSSVSQTVIDAVRVR